MSGSTASLLEQNSSGERERLGRFTLLRVLGRGASATVYEAVDTRMERPVALKVLSFDPLLTPEQRQRQIDRFEREARAVAQLSHPNIVSVYDVGEEDGKQFLVMELLSGVTLRERIDQGGPIALGEAASIVEQIASALDCTHAEGIVHRDIKPSNVLLLPDGRIKMLDFGIARRGEDATVTHLGTLIGSPAYMSPEQGRGEHASASSDIWSLGALLYEMLTGKSPFGAANVAAVLYKAAYDKPDPLPEDVSSAQQVIDHALAKQPEERYASAGAMANALRTAVDFASDPARPALLHSSESTVVKRSLHDAAAGAYISSSARSTIEDSTLPPGVGTAEISTRQRSRLTDFAVLAAWVTVVVAALGIVTVRMRESSTVAAPASATKSSTAAVTAPPSPAVSPGKAAVPTKPKEAPPTSASPVAAVQIVERTPPPPPSKTVVVVLPSARPSATPSPAAAVAKNAPEADAAATVSDRPQPAPPVKTAPRMPAPVPDAPASVEPPWDDRIDRLGDPEPEPEPAKTAATERPSPRQEDTNDGSSEKPRFKPLVLLGVWQGNIWKHKATLNVQSSSNDSFQGMLALKTEKGRVRFSVEGSFSPVTGRISFWSTGTPSEVAAAGADIGQGNGRLISSKTMGGISVDTNRRVFTWSFSR